MNAVTADNTAALVEGESVFIPSSYRAARNDEGGYHPPMYRRLFTILSGLSLLLCVGTCVLWVRSYWRELNISKFRLMTKGTEYADYAGKVGAFHLDVLRGRCGILVEMDSAFLSDDGQWHAYEWSTFVVAGDIVVQPPNYSPFVSNAPAPAFRIYWDFAGFAFYRNINDMSRDYRVIFPLWFVVLLSALPPAAWARMRMRSGRQASRGRCPSCGYDLRATPDRCPECGAVPIAKR